MNRMFWLILLLICSANLEATTVKLQPSLIKIETGATFTVDVVIENVTDLMGAEIHIRFDPAKLNQETVSAGEILGRPTGAQILFFPATATGKVGFATTRLGGSPQGISGTGTIAQISFKYIGQDMTELNIDSTDLRDINLQKVAITGTTGATVTIPFGTITTLDIIPSMATITAGGIVSYTAIANDDQGNTKTVTADTIFCSNDPQGTVTGSTYIAGKIGTWTITGIYTPTCKVGTATIVVTHGTVTTLSIIPSMATITEGGNMSYIATAKDAQGKTWTVTTDTTFSSNDTAGTWTGNEYTAGKVGVWTITGEYAGKTGTAMVVVVLGSVTVQDALGNLMGTFETIKAGVDVCPEGGIVSVLAGIYPEAVYIDKGIALVGIGFVTIDTSGFSNTNTVIFDGTDASSASITGFKITGATGDYPYGIGISCDNGANPIITNNTITGNEWVNIFCEYSSPTITNNTILGNNNNENIYCDNSSPTITNNIITGSSKGIDCVGSSPIITNNTLIMNDYGISCIYSSFPTITNNTIAENIIGMECCFSSSPLIINNIISGNSSAGIACWDNSSPTITNNTITGNEEAGIMCDNSSPTITNNIITENGITTYNYGIYVDSDIPAINYNCVWGNGQDGNDNYYGCSPGAKDISVNPKFIASNDFHLKEDSACINKGLNTAPYIPLTDKDGNSRIINDTVDIGAYEYQGTPTLTVIILTNISGNNQQATVTTTLTPCMVKLTDTYGNPVDYCSVTWQIIEPSYGAILSATTTTTNVNGTTSTILTLGTKTGTYYIIVNASGVIGTFTATANYGTVTSLNITPASATVTAGEIVSYTATAKDTQGNTWTVTTDTTFSSNGATAGTWTGSAYNAGRVGTWTITGKYNGKIGTATLVITHGMTTILDITPAMTNIQIGESVIYTATAKDAQGNTWIVTADTVFCSNDPQGTVTGSTYIAGKVGEWTISGIYNNDNIGTAKVIVLLEPVKNIVINPATISTQMYKQPFPFSITTVDKNNILVPYFGTLSLSNITNSISPQIIPIVNGIWTGTVSISKSSLNDMITCKIAGVKEISSNLFNVLMDNDITERIEDEKVSLNIKSGSVDGDYCLQINYRDNITAATNDEINQAIYHAGTTSVLSDTLCEIRGTSAAGELISYFNRPVTLNIKYKPDDLGNIDVKTLKLYRLSTSGSYWIPVPESEVNANNNMVTALISEPGIFILKGVSFGKISSDVIVCPIPFIANKDNVIKFCKLPEDGVTIEIYDLAGDMVKRIHTQKSEEEWDVRNGSGQIVDSGVYFYCVIGEKKGIAPVTGKMVIIR